MTLKERNLNKKVLGGALITGALFITFNFVAGYDQHNTHPALTDEAVDFYNLHYPDNPLSTEDKALLIKGAIEEDTPPRWLNHFYDPVHNTGWLGYTSSKKWATSSLTQQAFTDAAYSYGGFANLFSDGLSPTDFSYERALFDYAAGNRKRAMIAMGHVMHLLEDANVPEHTRGDTHLPWHGTESPYEKTMAKWNPQNFQIAESLFKKSVTPILFSSLSKYFDEIAEYSNSHFFSEDTINSEKYVLPKIIKVVESGFKNVDGKDIFIGLGNDKNGENFKLVFINAKKVRNIIKVTSFSLVEENIGNIILDDYWSRLSTDFVVHGAGVLKLFLDQAEKVKQEYAQNPQNRRGVSPIGKFLGFLGVSQADNNNGPLIFKPEAINSIINDDSTANAVNLTPTNDVVNDDNISNDVSFGLDRVNDDGLSSLTRSALPLSSNPATEAMDGTASVTKVTSSENQPKQPTSLNDDKKPLPSVTLTPTPIIYSFGTSSGGVAYDKPESTVTNSAPTTDDTFDTDIIDEEEPTPTVTPEPDEITETTNDEEVAIVPTTTTTTTILTPSVVINEIAWMGTGENRSLSNDEWIELYNPTSSPVDISGWKLKSLTDDSPDMVLASKSIEPFGYYLLERTNDDTVSGIPADQIYTGSLNDHGEVLVLIDADGNVRDVAGDPSVLATDDSVPWYAGNKNDRSSMERIDPLKPGTNADNWATNDGSSRTGKNAQGGVINGTPRAENSVYINKQPPLQVADSAAEPSLRLIGPSNPKITWQFSPEGANDISQPVVDKYGETVYFGAPYDITGTARLYAVDSSGAEKWHYDTRAVPSTPDVFDDGSVVFGQFDPGSDITALDTNGTKMWQTGAGDRVDGVAVDALGNALFTSESRKLAKIGADGLEKWQIFSPFTFPFRPLGGPGGDVFVAANNSGLPEYYRLKVDDGSVVWQTRSSDRFVYSTFDPVYDESTGKLYASTTDYGQIIELEAAGGGLAKSVIGMSARPTTQITLLPDLLVVAMELNKISPASGSMVYGIRKTDKEIAWTHHVGGSVNSKITADDDGNLYFATGNGGVYGIGADGQSRWFVDLGMPTGNYPVLGRGALYIGAGGKLVKIGD